MATTWSDAFGIKEYRMDVTFSTLLAQVPALFVLHPALRSYYLHTVSPEFEQDSCCECGISSRSSALVSHCSGAGDCQNPVLYYWNHIYRRLQGSYG